MFLAKVMVDCRLLTGHSITAPDSEYVQGVMVLDLKT